MAQPDTATAAPPGSPGDTVLQATGLTKHFPIARRGVRGVSGPPAVVHAVDDVTLTLRRGRVTALVGESGSGKSTVARLLARLYPRTGGDVTLHGAQVPARGGRGYKKYVGEVQMIFQDPFGSLNPVHTVRYHLTRSLRVHGNAGRGKAGLEQSLKELLGRVQLTPAEVYLDKYPHELSGGQRQRVAIARALAADPGILLADEPVSMLDVSIRLGVLNLLRDLKEKLNIAILYITHDIASARYFADETLVMYAGRMVEGGDSETVTQSPAHPYTRLLIGSAPDPDRLDGEAEAIDELERDGGSGEPPSLIRPPSGCRFHPRCPVAMPRCSEELPPHFALDDAPGHWAACWLYADNEIAAPAGATTLAVEVVTTKTATVVDTEAVVGTEAAAAVDAEGAEQSAENTVTVETVTEIVETVSVTETDTESAAEPAAKTEAGADDEEATP